MREVTRQSRLSTIFCIPSGEQFLLNRLVTPLMITRAICLDDSSAHSRNHAREHLVAFLISLKYSNSFVFAVTQLMWNTYSQWVCTSETVDGMVTSSFTNRNSLLVHTDKLLREHLSCALETWERVKRTAKTTGKINFMLQVLNASWELCKMERMSRRANGDEMNVTSLFYISTKIEFQWERSLSQRCTVDSYSIALTMLPTLCTQSCV